MSNECIIGGYRRWSQKRPQERITYRNQGEPFAYLPYDAYALRPSNAGPKWQTSERSVDLAEGAMRAAKGPAQLALDKTGQEG